MERQQNQAKHYQTFEDLEVYQVPRESRKDEAYSQIQEIESLEQEVWRVHKLINGYVRFLRKPASESPRVRENPTDDSPGDNEIEDSLLDRFTSLSLEHFNA